MKNDLPNRNTFFPKVLVEPRVWVNFEKQNISNFFIYQSFSGKFLWA